MRVAVYYNNSDVRIEDRPAPSPGPGEALVRVQACGICGSDTMEWYRVPKAPLVLGHEIAGEVAAVGQGVTRFQPGDRVVVTHHVPCNTCKHCLDGHHSVCDTLRTTHVDPGGFAELIRVPALQVDRGMWRIPDSMSFEEASFVEPLGCAVRGQGRSMFRPGWTVLVVGSGAAGALHIQLAKALGAGRIIATDLSPARLEWAKRLGADVVMNAREDVPAKVREHNDGHGADLVITCTAAAPALAQAFRSVGRGGSILFFAPTEPGRDVPLPLFDLWRDEIRMSSSYAAPPTDMQTALELIRAGRIDVKAMISHRLGLGDAPTGFRLVAEAGDSLKVIIEPQR